jgi:hypothetical protein
MRERREGIGDLGVGVGRRKDFSFSLRKPPFSFGCSLGSGFTSSTSTSTTHV